MYHYVEATKYVMKQQQIVLVSEHLILQRCECLFVHLCVSVHVFIRFLHVNV